MLAMRAEHQEKLMRMLEYIFDLRKQAYLKFRHVCDSSREQNCTDCRRRALFFNQQVRNYLTNDTQNDKENHLNKHQKT